MFEARPRQPFRRLAPPLMARSYDRGPAQLRPVSIQVGTNAFAEGSCIVEFGMTRVHVTASVEDRVPMHRRGTGLGWVTAEYSMLPRATLDRNQREVNQGRVGGRTQEIQRLIGRSLRAAVDMSRLGERTVTVDCDVLQADGGTRTAAITGGFVALYLATNRMRESGMIKSNPIRQYVAAVSCGIVDGRPLLDLDYAEDFRAETDLNCVMGDDGRILEIQATAEREPYTREELTAMVDLAAQGIRELIAIQKRVINQAG